MASKTLKRVCLTPKARGVGGMVSFQAKLIAGLATRGIQTTFGLDNGAYDAVLVVGGTRQLGALRRAKQRGIPIVQRLDGMNWLHRRLRTGLRHWLRAELGNRLLATIRNQVATHIVYQSNFVKTWWQGEHGAGPAHRIIHNGVDLQLFCPGPKLADSPISILMVEGSLMGGYELGLESAVELVRLLQSKQDSKVELSVAGSIDPKTKEKWQTQAKITWLGVIPNDQIPALNRSAHLLYSADLNPACPNSVIEALACGLPVLSFDTGALRELVTHGAGQTVPYGGDPWKLDPPDVEGLARGASEILANRSAFQQGARERAEAAFDLNKMVDDYIESMSG